MMSSSDSSRGCFTCLKEMIDEYLRLRPDAMNPEGVITAHFGRIEIEATKERGK